MQERILTSLWFFLQRLKDIFHGLTVFLSKDLEDHAKLKRFIIAYPLKYLFVKFNKNCFSRQRANHTFLCFVYQNRIHNVLIRTQLEFSGFNPNRNRPRIVNQCFFRELFEERNSRLKSGQRNAKFPTNTWYSYHGKSVFGLPFLTVTSFQHQLPWIWIQNICKERQHKHHYCNFSRVFYLLPYNIITELWSIKQDNQVFNHS